MTCPTCGAILDNEETVCPLCSAPVAGADAADPARSAAGPTSPPPVGTPQHATSTAVGGGHPSSYAHPSGLSSEVRGWGIASHLAGLGGGLATAVTLGFLGPLIIWLVKRDEHPFVDHHAKEALNFQLTTLLALVVSVVAAIPVAILGVLTLGVLWVVAAVAVMVAVVVWFVFPILGAVHASNGEGYRYPLSIRFVR